MQKSFIVLLPNASFINLIFLFLTFDNGLLTSELNVTNFSQHILQGLHNNMQYKPIIRVT